VGTAAERRFDRRSIARSREWRRLVLRPIDDLPVTVAINFCSRPLLQDFGSATSAAEFCTARRLPAPGRACCTMMVD
jgi:hypothetical protein